MPDIIFEPSCLGLLDSTNDVSSTPDVVMITWP